MVNSLNYDVKDVCEMRRLFLNYATRLFTRDHFCQGCIVVLLIDEISKMYFLLYVLE